jgi:hypothetical protein
MDVLAHDVWDQRNFGKWLRIRGNAGFQNGRIPRCHQAGEAKANGLDLGGLQQEIVRPEPPYSQKRAIAFPAIKTLSVPYRARAYLFVPP